MANSPVFGWAEPNDTDLVKNGASAMRTLGNAIDSSLDTIAGGISGKNALINGGFDIWQRGISSLASSAYTADRWYLTSSGGTCVASRESTVVPSGSLYSIKLTQSVANGTAYLNQAIETLNAIKFAGKSITVSAKIAASAATNFTLGVEYSTNTDNAVAGTWTAITATSGGTASASTTTFGSISGVFAIPATAKSIKVYVSAAITSGQSAYIGKAQFEEGTVATSFARAGGTIQGELAACQRYYFRNTASSNYNIFCAGMNYSATQAILLIQFPQAMRIAPSVLEYSNLGLDNSGAMPIALTSLVFAHNGNQTGMLTGTVASGLVAGNATMLSAQNSISGYVAISAEL